jgi:hypothetical protein
MFDRRSVLHEHDINVLHNRFEKPRGNSGTMKAKRLNIVHIAIRMKSDERGDLLVRDIRKTDVQATF